MHFQTWSDKAGNAPALTDPKDSSLVFPDLNSSPLGGEEFQTNLIMPEPTATRHNVTRFFTAHTCHICHISTRRSVLPVNYGVRCRCFRSRALAAAFKLGPLGDAGFLTHARRRGLHAHDHTTVIVHQIVVVVSQPRRCAALGGVGRIGIGGRNLFEEAGYVALTPGWPDDPETVSQAREHPEVFAGKGISEIADYEEAIIRRLKRKPVIIGHSFGGLLTMILAGRGLAAASVAISPAPFRGVLPLPIAALRTASVALRNPANWNRAIPLTYEQFRYSFANAVGEDEAKELYLGYSVPGAGEPLFQAASANFNPWSEAKVDSTNPKRGPMLIVSADSDHTVPWAIANASYKKQKRNQGVTEVVKMPGRGHALTIDAGWREVAEKALEFVKRFTKTTARAA
jgi:non-heme chloroperoxidase